MSISQSTRFSMWHVDVAGLAAIGLLTAAAYVTILAPMARSRLSLAGVRSDLVESNSRVAELRDIETTISSELTRVQAELDASPVHLESADRLNRRLARLMSVATESGLVIHESRASDVVAGSRFDLVPITVSGSGSYPNCAGFMHRLHDDLPDVEVLGFDVSGQPSNPAAIATFRFDLSWYAAPSIAAAAGESGEDL